MKSLALRILLPSALSVFALLGSNVYRDSGTDDSFMLPYPTDAETALDALRRGNKRFTTSHRTLSTNTRHDVHFRHAMARDQHPFVAMLACSDSRVCPEFIFDQSFGSIFEIRNAGNVVDDDVLASLEYAVDHLHVPLVVVLGHKGCGAIDPVCAAGEDPLHDHLRVLQEKMQGIRAEVLEGNHRHDAETVNRLSRENARQQVITVLHECPLIKAAIERGACQVVHALYDMETGLVEFSEVGQWPRLFELLRRGVDRHRLTATNRQHDSADLFGRVVRALNEQRVAIFAVLELLFTLARVDIAKDPFGLGVIGMG